MNEEFESTNIHLKWLENIFNQLKTIQDFERIAREGCRDLMEYFQVPINMQRVVMPDAQYKNLRFMALEMDILIDNVSNVLGLNYDSYKKRIGLVLKTINDRKLFLREIKNNNQLVSIEVLPFLNTSIDYVVNIKSNLIKDISSILFLPTGSDSDKKKW